MAQLPPPDPNPDMLGFAPDDVPQFPSRPFYIPLPAYYIPLMERPLSAVARLYCDASQSMAFVTFHPSYGRHPADLNQDVWLPVPPKEVFHLRHIHRAEELMLAPLDGRSYGFPLRKTVKVCVGNREMFCLEEVRRAKDKRKKGREERKKRKVLAAAQH